ncbi:hypothetical protein LEMLEM_LOCUS24858 [Lemmus lemmus]
MKTPRASFKASWSHLMNSTQGTRGRSDVFPNDARGQQHHVIYT